MTKEQKAFFYQIEGLLYQFREGAINKVELFDALVNCGCAPSTACNIVVLAEMA